MIDSCYIDSLRYQDSIIASQKNIIAEQRFQIEKRDALFDSWQKAKVAEDSLQERMIRSAKDVNEAEFRRTLVYTWIGLIGLTATILILK